MTLAPPTPSAGLQPLQLTWDLRLDPDQFERVCQANPDAVLELSADGQLIATTPAGSETGARNQALGALLWLAVRRSGLPLQAFDSSSGFRLPDGSVLSSDASLVRLERWRALFPREQLLVLKSEDFYRRPDVVFPRVLDFLGLPQWSPAQFREYNAGRYEQMTPSLERWLRDHFEPHNRRLYELLDEDWGWG